MDELEQLKKFLDIELEKHSKWAGEVPEWVIKRNEVIKKIKRKVICLQQKMEKK